MRFNFIKAFFFLILIFWGVYYIYVISTTVGYSSFYKIATKSKIVLFHVAPQGWGFFTKSPKDEYLLLFKKRENDSLEPLIQKNFTLNNIYGISRKQRFLSLEVSKLMSQTTNDQWNNCTEENINKCLVQKVDLNQLSSRNLLEGDYLVLREKHIPWAWAKSGISKKKFKIIWIDVNEFE